MAIPKKLLSDREVEFVNYLRENPDQAAELLFRHKSNPVKLGWHQRDFIRRFFKSQFGFMIWSRGAGKTFCMAIIALLKALLYPNHVVLIVAGSYRQAMNVFKEISLIYDDSLFVQQSALKPPSMTPVRCDLVFKHGSRISAIPIGDGSKIRGERCQTLLVDELLTVPENIVDTVLLPFLNVRSDPWARSLTVKNSLLFATTATYQFTHVYKYYREFLEKTTPGSPAYDPEHVLSVINILDVPPEWLEWNIIHMQLRTMSRARWLMENMSMFPADSDGYYSAKILDRARKAHVQVEAVGEKGAEYVMGVDPGRESSNFAISLIKLGEKEHQWVFTKTLYRATTQEQINLIREVVRKFNVVWIQMDLGGGGMNLRDYLAIPHSWFDGQRGIWVEEPPIVEPTSDVDGLRILHLHHPSAKDNTEMNENLKTWFENEVIVLPRYAPDDDDDEKHKIYLEIQEAVNEILDIVAKPLSSGFFTFTTRSKDMKKDRYSSLLLATYGVKQYLAQRNRQITGEYNINGLIFEGVPWQSSWRWGALW